MPWLVVPPLGSLGTTYLDISSQFRDKVTELHLHALKLLETPAGTMLGGTAWADLGFCALAIDDLELADEVFKKGLNVPTMFMHVEKARLTAGSALLALTRGEVDEAAWLAQEALAIAQEKSMRHMYPLTHRTMGKVLAAQGQTDAALEAFERAESDALELGMRPFVWQTRMAAAETLEAAGRSEEAEAKRAAARTMVEEIAASITDGTLREAYLGNSLAKVGVSDQVLS